VPHASQAQVHSTNQILDQAQGLNAIETRRANPTIAEPARVDQALRSTARRSEGRALDDSVDAQKWLCSERKKCGVRWLRFARLERRRAMALAVS